MVKFNNLVYYLYNTPDYYIIYLICSTTVKKNGAFLEMPWIMWASASLSMTDSEFAVYHGGSQVLRRGDKAQHSGRKRQWALGEMCWGDS